jgi:hypothetical protein
MSFWAGFACGIAATYSLALLVIALLAVRRRPRVLEPAPPPPQPDASLSPTVCFTHESTIAPYVRGGDG